MKNIFNMKWGMWMAALLTVLSLGMVSCSDDDGSGQPEITGVRVCDPEYADSLFTKSAQGQTIAIIGKNLSNIRKVYINDQEVYFSPTMNTDHSVIVKVPSETDGFELTAFNSELKDEIRVETSHGTATYAFKVLGQAPSISRIQATYPRSTGDVLNIYGTNLYSIESIYFTDVTATALDTLTWDEVPGNHVVVSDYTTVLADRHLNSNQNYEVTSQLQLTIPELSFDQGALVIECAAGTRYIAFSKLPSAPVIKSISSDMPVLGETLVIKGNEFIQVESVTFGDVTYTADEFTVADSEDEIDILITKTPTEGSGTTLQVTTPGGSTTVANFYDYSTLLFNFDDHYATDNGWGPNCSFESANTEAAPYMSSGTYARITQRESGADWWGMMIFFRYDWGDNIFPLPGNDVIPDATSTDDIYLAMEVYNNNSEYNNGTFGGYLRYNIWEIGGDTGNTSDQVDNFEWDDYDAGTFTNPLGPVLSDINGKAPVGKWYRHVFKLSNFPLYAGLTYADVQRIGISNVRIQCINQTNNPGDVDICVDNVRLIYIKP